MLKNIWRWELYINYEIALSIDDWWRKALNEEQLSAPSIKVSPNGEMFTNLVRLDSKITKIGPFKKFLVCALKKYYQFSSCFHFTRGLAISQKKRQAILNYDSTGSRHYGNFGGRNDSGGKDECPFPVGMESKKVLIIKMADTPLKNRAQWEIPSCFSRLILRKMEIWSSTMGGKLLENLLIWNTTLNRYLNENSN